MKSIRCFSHFSNRCEACAISGNSSSNTEPASMSILLEMDPIRPFLSINSEHEGKNLKEFRTILSGKLLKALVYYMHIDTIIVFLVALGLASQQAALEHNYSQDEHIALKRIAKSCFAF